MKSPFTFILILLIPLSFPTGLAFAQQGSKEKDNGNRWTIPVGGGVSKVFAAGKQSMNLAIAAFKNVKKPDIIGHDWTLEITVQLLFPK